MYTRRSSCSPGTRSKRLFLACRAASRRPKDLPRADPPPILTDGEKGAFGPAAQDLDPRIFVVQLALPAADLRLKREGDARPAARVTI